MNEKLIEYLKKHVEKGSDMERVKQALLSAGHDIKIVEEHINYVIDHHINTKKIRKYALTAVILILVIIASVTGFYYFSKFYKKTYTSNEFVNISKEYQKNLESFNQALITNDTNVCDKIEDDALKNECKRKFEFDFNKTEEKISFNETADKKIFNRALINHNESICLEITDASLRNQCGQIVKG